MPNDLRTIELLIKATSEQGVSERTAAQLQQIASNLTGIGKGAEDATSKVISMTAALGRLTGNRELVQVADQFRAVSQAAGEANQQVSQLETRTRSAAGGGGRFGGGVGPGGLGFAEFLGGMAVRTLPQGPVGGVLTSSLLGAGSVNSIISQIQQMSTAMGGLGPALTSVLAGLGPVTLAFLALNTVVALFKGAADEAKKVIEDQIEALKLFYDTIEKGTTESVEAAIRKNEAEQTRQKAAIAELDKQKSDVARDIIGEGGRPSPRTLELLAKQQALNEARDKEQQTLDGLVKNHEALTKALDSEAVSARTRVEQAVDEGKIKRTGSSKSITEEMAELTDRMNADADVIAEINQKIASGTATKDDLVAKAQRIQDLNDAIQNFDADKALLPYVQAREREEEEIKRLVAEQDKRNQALERETEAIKRTQEQIDALQADRDKQLSRQAEEDAISAERTGVTRDYQRRIQEAKDIEAEEDHQRDIRKMKDAEAMQERRLTEGYNRQVDKINSEFMETELKATQDFRNREADDLAKFNKRYARALEDMQDRLTDAASRRDVAGFIQAQRDGEKQLRRLAEDFQDQDKERVAAFAKERAQARDNRAKQLAEATRAYQEQLQLLRDQLAERLAADREAHQYRLRQSEVLERQFQQQRESWQIQDNLRRRAIEEQDFNERMAILQQKLAQQRALIGQIYTQTAQAPFQATTPGGVMAGALGAVNTVVSNPFGALSGLLGGGNWTPVSAAPTVNIGKPLPSSSYRPRSGVSRFAGGMDFVPHDFFPAFLDYGERVMSRRDNENYASGRSGGMTVNIFNTVGDIATKSMLDNYQVETVRGIRKALKG